MTATWEHINRVFDEADAIEKLIRLYREKPGVSYEEAKERAIAEWRKAKRKEGDA